jgi:hypothetical protein
MKDRIPEYLLERLATGDLPPPQAEALRQRLAREPDGSARLAGLAADNASVLAAHPPAVMADAIRRRAAVRGAPLDGLETGGAGRAGLAPQKPRRAAFTFSFALAVPAAAVAALGCLLWLRAPGGSHSPRPVPTEDRDLSTDRSKGLAPRLLVYRHRGGQVERLHDGDLTRAGDELQLAYVAGGHRFGAVLSIDGGGHITSHLARERGGSVRLRTDGEIALPEAYQLDAAPGYERFLFLASNEPIGGEVVRQWMLGLGRHALDTPPRPPAPGVEVVSFTVRKKAQESSGVTP